MKVYRGLKGFLKVQNAVVTSGTFDGVHLGHQKILNTVIEGAKSSDGESVVITFWPHPRKVLFPDQPVFLLTSLNEKIKQLEALGIDNLLVIPFTREFSELSSAQFIRQVLVETIKTSRLVIGYDHKFGKNREGSFDYLRQNSAQYGFQVEEIPREDIDNIAISSTRIRKAVSDGNLKTAFELLGRYYSLTGTVVHGQKLGRKLGYPTANVHPDDPDKLLPADGIYAILAEVNGKLHKGMLSIGFRPTVHGTERTIEANIFDFSADIYGRNIDIHFLEYLRPEKKFDTLDELIRAIEVDKENSLQALRHIKL